MRHRIVKIKNPKVILTEWIPFGKNYMTEFIDRDYTKRVSKKKNQILHSIRE